MTRSELRKKAREQLKGKYSPFVLGLLAFIGVILALMIPFFLTVGLSAIDPNSTGEAAVASIIPVYILFMAFFIVLYPMCIMVFIKGIRTAAELPETEQFTFKTLMSGFKTAACGIGNYWWTYLWIWLWELFCFIPVLIAVIIAVVSGVNMNIDGPSTGFVLILFICYVFVFFVIINRAIAYSMNWYFLAVDHNIGAIEAMKKSKLITKGHKWYLFVLSLSFIGWYLLCIITCGILALWVVPYYNMTIYNAFKYLTDEYNKNSPEPIIAPAVDNSKALESSNPYFANDIGKSEPEAPAPENPAPQE